MWGSEFLPLMRFAGRSEVGDGCRRRGGCSCSEEAPVKSTISIVLGSMVSHGDGRPLLGRGRDDPDMSENSCRDGWDIGDDEDGQVR